MLVAMSFVGSVTFPVYNTWCGMILYSSSNNLCYAFTVVPSLRHNRVKLWLEQSLMRDEVFVSMIQGDNTNFQENRT